MVFWALSCCYVALTCGVIAAELRRSGKFSSDPLGIFVLIATLQCVLPGILIYALLPISRRGEATGMEVFDHIYSYADASSAFLVFGITCTFLYFTYVGAQTTRSMLARRFGVPEELRQYELRVSSRALVATLVLGLAFTAIAFQSMGESFIERYANLILLRSVDVGAEQTALTSNALALLQSWSWLGIVALFAVRDRYGKRWLWYACLLMLIAFAFLGVSRRALFLPIVFSYLIYVMSDGRWRFGKLLALGVAILPMLAFGKEILAAISFGGAPEQVEQTYSTLVTAGMRTSTDVGITITESLGTISMIDLPPRYGVDHLMSALQRFPEGILGLEFDFPERIVRISTATFANDWTVDIPPGLMGQMWLDFRVLGPVIWGLAFGLQIGFLQYAWARTRRSLQTAAVFFVLTFIVALPINTGSYDFTFSVDIFLVIAILLLTVRRRPAKSTRVSIVDGPAESP